MMVSLSASDGEIKVKVLTKNIAIGLSCQNR